MAIWIVRGYGRDCKNRRHEFEFEADTFDTDYLKEVAGSRYALDDVNITYCNTKKPESVITSGNTGLGPVGNVASSITESDNGGVQLFGLLALIAAGYIVWFSAPVIAFVGSGGLAFKTIKNRTGGMQWAKRTGAFLLATGLASMASFHGTIATQESLATWWNENTTEQVSSN